MWKITVELSQGIQLAFLSYQTSHWSPSHCCHMLFRSYMNLFVIIFASVASYVFQILHGRWTMSCDVKKVLGIDWWVWIKVNLFSIGFELWLEIICEMFHWLSVLRNVSVLLFHSIIIHNSSVGSVLAALSHHYTRQMATSVIERITYSIFIPSLDWFLHIRCLD